MAYDVYPGAIPLEEPPAPAPQPETEPQALYPGAMPVDEPSPVQQANPFIGSAPTPAPPPVQADSTPYVDTGIEGPYAQHTFDEQQAINAQNDVAKNTAQMKIDRLAKLGIKANPQALPSWEEINQKEDAARNLETGNRKALEAKQDEANKHGFLYNTADAAIQSGRSIHARGAAIMAAHPHLTAPFTMGASELAPYVGSAEGFDRMSRQSSEEKSIAEAGRANAIKDLPSPIQRVMTIVADAVPRMATGPAAPFIFAAEGANDHYNAAIKEGATPLQAGLGAVFMGIVAGYTPAIMHGGGITGKEVKDIAAAFVKSGAKAYPQVVLQQIASKVIQSASAVDSSHPITLDDLQGILKDSLIDAPVMGGIGTTHDLITKNYLPTKQEAENTARESVSRTQFNAFRSSNREIAQRVTDAYVNAGELAPEQAGMPPQDVRAKIMQDVGAINESNLKNNLSKEQGLADFDKMMVDASRNNFKDQLDSSLPSDEGAKTQIGGIGNSIDAVVDKAMKPASETAKEGAVKQLHMVPGFPNEVPNPVEEPKLEQTSVDRRQSERPADMSTQVPQTVEDLRGMSPAEIVANVPKPEGKSAIDMSEVERVAELYRSPIEGMPLANKRAYQEDLRQRPNATHFNVDGDTIKYINDTFGHDAGDVLLQVMGNVLHESGVAGYHISGDEFKVLSDHPDIDRKRIQSALDRLSKSEVVYKLPDGREIHHLGAGFSFGEGRNNDLAEEKLKQHKSEREAAGTRTARGERPSGLVEHTPEGRKADNTPASNTGPSPKPSVPSGKTTENEPRQAGTGETASKRNTVDSGQSPKPKQRKYIGSKPVSSNPELSNELQAEHDKLNEVNRQEPKYSIKGEPVGAPLTKEHVEQAFPGSEVNEDSGGYKVTLASGHSLDVKVVDEIKVDWLAAESALGRKISAKERKGLKAAGSFEITAEDGSKVSGLGLLQIARGVGDDATLRHETVHLAKAMGMFTEAEWNALVKAHSSPDKSPAEQEEDIATARESWPAGGVQKSVFSKIKSWALNILRQNGVIEEATPENKAEINALLDQAAFWEREPSNVGGKPIVTLNFTGRPDLANPGTTEGVRNLVDMTDEALKAKNFTRHDATTMATAQDLVDNKYEETKKALLAAGSSGGQLSDAQTVAAKMIIQREGLAAIRSGRNERLAEAAKIIEAYRNTGTEQARAFRARSDPIESPAQRNLRMMTEGMLTPDFKTNNRIKAARAKNDHSEANRLLEAWAAKISNVKYQLKQMGIDANKLDEIAKDPVASAKVVGQIATAKHDNWDAAYEYWRSSILSGKAAPAKLASDIVFGAKHFLVDGLVESAINSVLRRPESMHFSDLGEYAKGMGPGLARGMRNFWLTFDTERSQFNEDLSKARGKPAGTGFEAHEPAISGAKGRMIRLFPRIIGAVHDMSMSIIANMQVGAEAAKLGRTKGLSGDKLSSFINDQVMDLKSESWVRASAQANYQTFQDAGKLESVVKLGTAAKDIAGLRYIVPFVKTPTGFVNAAYHESPLGALSIPSHVMEGFKTGDYSKAVTAAAKQTIAWGTMLAMASVISQKDSPITGSKDKDHPYSIRVGDTWVSYSRLEPFATVFGLVVDAMHAKHEYQTTGNSGKLAEDALKAVIKQVEGKTYLQGLADFLKMAEDVQQGNNKPVEKWAARFALSWAPYSGAEHNTGRAFQDSASDRSVFTSSTWLKGSELQSIPGVNNIPGIKELKDAPKYDVWGRKTDYASFGALTDLPLRLLAPTTFIKDKEKFVGDHVIMAWNYNHPDAEIDLKPPSTFYRLHGKSVEYTPEQYNEFTRLAGLFARNKVSEVNWNVDNPSAQERKKLADIIKLSRKYARNTVLKTHEAEDSE